MPKDKSLSLTKLQESILREYKRVSYGEETPQYDVQSIYYSDTPKQLPQFLSNHFQKSILLYNYSFFQMISFAVLEFLFTSPHPLKSNIVEKIKIKICAQEFMFGSNFTKGLLIKGLRSILQKRNGYQKPIAQILLKNQAINAFSQFWKEIIEEQSGGSFIKHSEISETMAFRNISSFLGINFQLFRKKDNSFQGQMITSKQTATKTAENTINIVIFDKNLVQSIIDKVLEENQANANKRGYAILLSKEDKATVLPFSHEKSTKTDILELLNKSSAVKKRGNDMLNKFRQIYREMREHL